MNNIHNSLKSLLRGFLNRMMIVIDNILGIFYVYRGNKLIESEKEEAYHLYKKGIERYPKNYTLNKKLAILEMNKKNWQEALKYWKFVFRLNKKPGINIYLNYSKALYENNEIKNAEKILKEGNAEFPKNKFLIWKLADIAVEQNDWKKAVKYMECYYSVSESSELPYDKYMRLVYGYKTLGNYNKAEEIVMKALEKFPNKYLEIQKSHIDILIRKKDWSSAIEKVEKQLSLGHDFEYEIQLSMLQKIVGNDKASQNTFNNVLLTHEGKIKQDQKGYRKIIIYDNGESRIEFYKKLQRTESVMITFDSINMEWQNRPFAFKLLMRQNLDIIAIRKRKKKTYQQDLMQSDFLNVVKPIIKGYKDKMAYGFSLGAYNALYFASLLHCRILAYSPRLSIHPQFGRTKIIPKFEMKHDLAHPYNDKITPIIVYDPKNDLDHTYIQKSVLKSFPNAKLVKIPYGGHGIAPHLLKMGVLKEFLITFINGGVPHYNRELKVKSHIYLRNLGEKCFKHNKPKWALDLSQRALEIDPSDEKAIKLKIKALKRLKRYNEATNLSDVQ